MCDFITYMELEKRRLEKQIETATKKLAMAPEGSLSIRKRTKHYSYYWNIEVSKRPNRIKKQINITRDKNLILQLTEKVIQQKVLKQAGQNLFHLNHCIKNYQVSDAEVVAHSLNSQYKHVLHERKVQHIQTLKNLPYPKAQFNPNSHIHETDCGELVRSKSEQIILNTLGSYDFIVHYEEEFLYKVGVPGIGRVYPDFTIILPDGSRIIWEHLGLLDDPNYCRRFAAKLNLYQQNGYVIGKNLIITMDDSKGNISSGLILDAIANYILPKLEAITRIR